MDNGQPLDVNELSRYNVRNSVCSEWLLGASLEHNDEGQPILDKPLFSPAEII